VARKQLLGAKEVEIRKTRETRGGSVGHKVDTEIEILRSGYKQTQSEENLNLESTISW